MLVCAISGEAVGVMFYIVKDLDDYALVCNWNPVFVGWLLFKEDDVDGVWNGIDGGLVF